MLWLIPAILSALFDSLKDIASKKSLKNVEPEVAALAKTLFAVPVVLVALLIFEKSGLIDIFSSFCRRV